MYGSAYWTVRKSSKVKSPGCYIPRFSFKTLILEKIFKCVHHIWAWQPSCSVCVCGGGGPFKQIIKTFSTEGPI